MRTELEQVFRLLGDVNVSGYASVKSLAVAMDMIGNILKQMERGDLVVRHREGGKCGTESKRETN